MINDGQWFPIKHVTSDCLKDSFDSILVVSGVTGNWEGLMIVCVLYTTKTIMWFIIGGRLPIKHVTCDCLSSSLECMGSDMNMESLKVVCLLYTKKTITWSLVGDGYPIKHFTN